MQSLSNIPPIWEYFKSTNNADTQRTQLVETMKRWAKEHDVQINRGIYFDKTTMDDIVRLEFWSSTPMAYLHGRTGNITDGLLPMNREQNG